MKDLTYSKDDILDIIKEYLNDTPERFDYLVDVIAEAFNMNGEDLMLLIKDQ
jgi:hypothetical protein